MNIITGNWMSHAVRVVVQLGIPDLLAKRPCTAEELSSAGFRVQRRLPRSDCRVLAQPADRRSAEELPDRRDSRRRRRQGPHGVDRDGAGRWAVRSRADPQWDKP